MPSSIQSVLVLLSAINMAVMLGVGGRLLLVAARTRRVPEGAIGTSTAFGALGVLLSLAATSTLERDPAAFPLWAAGRLALSIGACGLGIGCWRIFRPDESWAAALAAMLCAVALTGCAMRVFAGTIPTPADTSLGGLLSASASLAAFGWTGGEALRYHLQLKRRLRLGLADPLLTHRFGLWALSGALAVATTITSLVYAYLLHRPVSQSPAVFVAAQLALFVASISLWLAFYPPAFYRRRVLSADPASSG